MNKNDYNTAEQIKTKRLLDFYKNYEKEVAPYIEEYEKERIKYIKRFSIFVMFITALLWLFITHLYSILDRIMTTIIALIFLRILYHNSINLLYKRAIKQQLMSKTIHSIGEINWSLCKQIISDETISKSKLFGSYNTRTNDDEFEGKYNGLNFKISESKLSEITETKDGYSEAIVFKGIIILIDTNKKTTAHTIIETKTESNKRIKNKIIMLIMLLLLPIGAIIDDATTTQDIFNNPKLFMVKMTVSLAFVIPAIIAELVEKKQQMLSMNLEDPEFNKKFNVITDDQVEGRYLITPAFMDRFKNLQTAFKTKNIECAFFDDKIMFALHTNKDFFELSGGLFHSLKDPKQIKSFYNEITAIYDIIDYFKLSEKTGL